jgi:hypothetical protein
MKQKRNKKGGGGGNVGLTSTVTSSLLSNGTSTHARTTSKTAPARLEGFDDDGEEDNALFKVAPRRPFCAAQKECRRPRFFPSSRLAILFCKFAILFSSRFFPLRRTGELTPLNTGTWQPEISSRRAFIIVDENHFWADMYICNYQSHRYMWAKNHQSHKYIAACIFLNFLNGQTHIFVN